PFSLTLDSPLRIRRGAGRLYSSARDEVLLFHHLIFSKSRSLTLAEKMPARLRQAHCPLTLRRKCGYNAPNWYHTRSLPVSAIGAFTFVLHSHLPYARMAGRWPHGEEWIHEAATETYLPLLQALYDLKEEGVKYKITIGI